MYVTQLITDSEMRRKAWQTIQQCVTVTLSKFNCNYITPSILYVILSVTKVMHQKILICDTFCTWADASIDPLDERSIVWHYK